MTSLSLPESIQLSLEVIDTPGGLENIRQQWQRLYESCPWATPFQSPDWLIPWWKHLGTGRLCTLASFAGNTLAGIAPLYIQDRRLFFLGTGASDYLDFVAGPEFGKQTAELFVEYLMNSTHHADSCDLQEIRAGSPLLSLNLRSLKHLCTPLSVCPVVELPSSSEEYFSKKVVSPLRRTVRKAMKSMAPYRVEKAAPQSVPEFIEKFFLLHASRWKERNQPGVLDRSQIQSFHREVAQLFASRGSLGLYGLWHQEQLAAILYSFRKDGRVYAYLSGFDPGLEDLSPGALLIFHVIEDSILQGAREFDFLRGNERYKSLWGATETQSFRLEISKE